MHIIFCFNLKVGYHVLCELKFLDTFNGNPTDYAQITEGLSN